MANDVDEKKKNEFVEGYSKEPTLTSDVKENILNNTGSLLNDESMSDVTFIIDCNNQIKEYCGIRVFFAAQSVVFKLSN